MILRCRALRCIAIGIPLIAFVTYGIGFWGPPFMRRVHGIDASTAGTVLGLSAAVGGLIGVTFGGWLSDRLRARSINARLWVAIAAPLLSIPIAFVFITTGDVTIAYLCSFLFSVVSPMWLGPGAGTVNDLVMPRMRAMASAFYLLMVTFIGLALGPFTMGQLSDAFAKSGMTPADALREGMLWGLLSDGRGRCISGACVALPRIRRDHSARSCASGGRACVTHPSGNRLGRTRRESTPIAFSGDVMTTFAF